MPNVGADEVQLSVRDDVCTRIFEPSIFEIEVH